MNGKTKLSAPLEKIVWRDPEELNANDYNPNIVMTKEMELLKLSLEQNGWIQPILISTDDMIIDGFHRVTIARLNQWLVPCCVLSMEPAERMMLTIRINRAKGSHVALRMSDIIIKLIKDGVSEAHIQEGIGATKEEIDILKKGTCSRPWIYPSGITQERGFLNPTRKRGHHDTF